VYDVTIRSLIFDPRSPLTLCGQVVLHLAILK
jgi:hypothetical protein